MSATSEYQDLLERKGFSLRALGVRDIALARVDALLAVELLRRARIPILGGDVYFKSESGIEPAYADWYSQPIATEAVADFADRSCRETEEYIIGFPPSHATPVFALVVAKSDNSGKAGVIL